MPWKKRKKEKKTKLLVIQCFIMLISSVINENQFHLISFHYIEIYFRHPLSVILQFGVKCLSGVWWWCVGGCLSVLSSVGEVGWG